MKKNWIIAFIAAVICSLVFIYTYFDRALPFVNVIITMNSDQLQNEAKKVAENAGWGVKDFSIVSRFQSEDHLQAFVELEGGGKQAFINMIDQGYYQPFLWRVRFFKEKEVKEVIVHFTPQGQKYEFAIKLSEDQCGAALTKDEALKIALDGASRWSVDLTPYYQIEYNSVIVSSGRIDHLFVYEREDVTLKEGKYRIKLCVSGDLFSELSYYVKIPDEFNRRYQQTFSTNKLVAGLAKNCAIFIYLFIIALFAVLFFYQRRGSFLLLSHIKMMTIFGFLQVLSAFNRWPLIWNLYQTHIAKSAFVLSQLGSMVMSIVLFALFVGFICLVVETMDRYVFKNHIQFFLLWSRSVASSSDIFKQTVLGYGCAIIFLAYIVAFCLLSQYFGWWVPLNTLIDPNILSTRLPFLSPLINAFNAGFWEEFATRGLPLAGIMLLTRNLKNQKKWLIGMFIIQAIIFGALHAHYPQQPSYCRIVELIIPSLGFGALYYFFGLLPGIIMHFVYDALLMSLPVFVSDLWFHKIMAIFIILVPFWVVVIAYLVSGRRITPISASALNGAWIFANEQKNHNLLGRDTGNFLSNGTTRFAILFAMVGICLWSFSGDFEFQSSRVKISQKQAQANARDAVEAYFSSLDDLWTVACTFSNSINEAGAKFVWQTYGKDEYQKLIGSYIIPPSFIIKYLKFSGPVELRAEQFIVVVSGDGKVLAMQHTLPEFVSGADISCQHAQKIAYDHVKKFYGIDKKDLEMIAQSSIKHESRRDWHIEFQDKLYFKEKNGQARIVIAIDGDKVSSWSRHVYSPEDWQRKEQNRLAQDDMLASIRLITVALWCFIAFALSIARYGFNKNLFLMVFFLTGLMVLLGLINLANAFGQIIFQLSTAEPIAHQVANFLSNSIVSYLAVSVFAGLLLVFITTLGRRSRLKHLVVLSRHQGFFATLKNSIIAIFLGCGAQGVSAYLIHLFPHYAAPAAYYDLLNFKFMPLAIVLSFVLTQVVTSFVVLASMFLVIEFFAVRYSSKMLEIILFIIAGIVIMNPASLAHSAIWIISGTIMGLMLYLLNRYYFSHDIDLLWIVLSAFYLFKLFATALFAAYPGIIFSLIIASMVSLFSAIMLYRKL